jgi:uncharacterized protein (TIGR03437 family)
LALTVEANTSTATRTAAFTIAGLTGYINQTGSGQAVSSLAALASGGVLNAASDAPTIAPGSFVSIYGQNLSDVTDNWDSAIGTGNTLPTALRGTRVRINGRDSYVCFVSPGQLNVLAPPDTATGPATVEVITSRGTAVTTVAMEREAPGLFTYVAQGQKYVAALTAPDYAYVAPAGVLPGATSRPAAAGEYVQLFANGLGPTSPAYPEGRLLSTAYPVPDLARVQVTVGGQPAQVVFAGLVAPGLFQVNIRVPEGVASGNVPVVLTVGDHSSQTNAAIAVR